MIIFKCSVKCIVLKTQHKAYSSFTFEMLVLKKNNNLFCLHFYTVSQRSKDFGNSWWRVDLGQTWTDTSTTLMPMKHFHLVYCATAVLSAGFYDVHSLRVTSRNFLVLRIARPFPQTITHTETTIEISR